MLSRTTHQDKNKARGHFLPLSRVPQEDQMFYCNEKRLLFPIKPGTLLLLDFYSTKKYSQKWQVLVCRIQREIFVLSHQKKKRFQIFTESIVSGNNRA